jgi:RNA polymerase sigma-70 factor (ECF subfamily)
MHAQARNHATPRPPSEANEADEELAARLAAGDQDTLAVLYQRYARHIFNVAVQSLDPAAAEDVAQDVIFEVWRNAGAFNAGQGSFRAWVLQLAHWRVLNELRRRSRRPQLDPSLETELLGIPDHAADPADLATRTERRAILQAAVAALPAGQREALGLAFFEELTHEEVAARLGVPLGTAKTRIRGGILKLRATLAPVAAALVLLLGLGTLAVQSVVERAALDRDERALALLTTSDVPEVRLTPAPGFADPAHGHFRSRPGASIAVLNVTSLPPAPAGRVYVGWVEHAGQWLRLGQVPTDSSGTGRVIAESPELATPAERVEVTLEAADAGSAPTGPVVIAWSAGG